jgi:thioredoxin reductase (NADPH)
VEEARNHPKINFVMESTLTAYYGEEKIENVDIKNLNTGEVRNFKTDGVFIFIGYLPNTEFLKDKIALNASNEIIVNNDMATNVEGVYAAGDSIAKRYRQVTTAVADGTIAALAASNYIHQLKTKNKLTLTH